MIKKRVSLLGEEALERVHAESLRVLESVGVQVDDPECVEILRRAGARVDGRSSTVRLPGPMVIEAMEQVTKAFDLVAPDGARHQMPSERPLLASRVKMGKILDYGAQHAREPCHEDVVNLCKITNALPCVEFSYAVDYPSTDVPPELDIADTVGLMYAVTGNPGVCAPVSEAAGRTWVDIAQAANGSGASEHLPGLLVSICTTGPLRLEAENGRLLRHVVSRGVPLSAEPMPMAGVSAPFTLAGTLVLDNAEALFLFTLANAVRPGAKVTYGALGSIMNMRQANLSMGAPETMLLSSAETAMARFYGLSTYRPACYTDSYYPDVQAGIEKAAFTLMVLLSGADLVLMGGSLNNADSLSYEQVVLDHDVWELARRLTAEIWVDESTLTYESIAEVGIGGSYLDLDHTLRWLRTGEHYYGGSFSRSGEPGEEHTMLARAHERVVEALSEPLEFRAPPEAVERIKQYVRDEARRARVAVPDWAV